MRIVIVTHQDKQISHIKQSLPFSQNIHNLAINAGKNYTKNSGINTS